MFKTEKIMLVLSLAIACIAASPALADRDDRDKRGRKTPVERFCPDGYTEIGHYEPFENRARTVCATDVLVTPNSEIFRDVIRDTVVFPVCMAKDSLGEGAITTLTRFVSEALTVALEESAAVTEEALNLLLAELETNLNEALAGVELGTNTSLAAITTGINTTLSSTETSLNAIDGQLNKVDDELPMGCLPRATSLLISSRVWMILISCRILSMKEPLMVRYGFPLVVSPILTFPM